MTAETPGQRVSLDALLEHRAWVRALARSLVSDPSVADDVEQETWRMVLERPPRHAASLRAWLATVVRNAARVSGRSRARRARHESAALPRSPAPSPDDVVAEAEIQHRLVRAVLDLDEPYRTAVLHRFFEGMEPAAIAARLGVPVETVRTRVKRAVARLRERMEGELGRDREAWALLLVGSRRPDASGTGAGSTGSGAALAGAAGGMAVGIAIKVGVAAVVLAAAVFVWSVGASAPTAPPAESAQGPQPVASAHPPERGRVASPSPPAAEPAATAGGPTDWNPETDVRGVVVDHAGRPIAGASVSAEEWSMATLTSMLSGSAAPAAELARARATGEGAFVLRVGAGAEVLVRASADGYGDSELVGRQAGESLRIVLGPPVSIRVHVEDENGAAWPSARVLAMAGSSDRGAPRLMRAGTTGSDGSVAWHGLTRVEGGRIDVLVVPGESRAPRSTHSAFAEGDETTVSLRLSRDRLVEGRVVDAADGAPVAGARVGVWPTGDPITTSGADGAFQIVGWARDSGRELSVAADGYARGVVPVADPPVSPVEVRLVRGFEVVGRVADPSGAPVAAAAVSLLARADWVHATSAADGTFRVGPISTREVYALVARGGGDALHVPFVEPPQQGEARVDVGTLVLLPTRVLRGRVARADGTGVGGVRVGISSEPVPVGIPDSRTTLSDGRFAFDRVPAGRWRVSAQTRSRPQPDAVVEVIADADPEPVVLVVDEPPAAPAAAVVRHRVRASVVDEDGTPVTTPGVNLQLLYVANGAATTVAADASGSTELAGEFAPSSVSVHLEGEAALRYARPVIAALRPGQPDVRIVLRRAELIRGRVLDPDGAPLAAAEVTADVRGGGWGYAATGPDGSFDLAVPAGSVCDLRARPQTLRGRALVFAELDGVRAGADGVVLRLRRPGPARTLRVVVRDPDGLPVDGAMLDVRPMDAAESLYAFTEADGAAEIAQVPGVPVLVSTMLADPTGDRQRSRGAPEVRVGPSETSVTIVAGPWRVLTGRVVDTNGSAAAGAHVFAWKLGAHSQVEAASDGSFAIDVPAAAELPITVTASSATFDMAAPVSGYGYDLVESWDQELVIRLVPVPAR